MWRQRVLMGILIFLSFPALATLDPPQDSQKVGALFTLVSDKEQALSNAQRQAQSVLEKTRRALSHILANAYILQRVTQLQRRYGEEEAPHKKAYLRLILLRLMTQRIQTVQHYTSQLTQIQEEQERLQQIMQTLQFRAQAWTHHLTHE